MDKKEARGTGCCQDAQEAALSELRALFEGWSVCRTAAAWLPSCSSRCLVRHEAIIIGLILVMSEWRDGLQQIICSSYSVALLAKSASRRSTCDRITP